jgi:hypothetical protein
MQKITAEFLVVFVRKANFGGAFALISTLTNHHRNICQPRARNATSLWTKGTTRSFSWL